MFDINFSYWLVSWLVGQEKRILAENVGNAPVAFQYLLLSWKAESWNVGNQKEKS